MEKICCNYIIKYFAGEQQLPFFKWDKTEQRNGKRLQEKARRLPDKVHVSHK